MRFSSISYFWVAVPLLWTGGLNANELSPHYDQADRIVVIKSERKLSLFKDGEVLRSFDIHLVLYRRARSGVREIFAPPRGIISWKLKIPTATIFSRSWCRIQTHKTARERS